MKINKQINKKSKQTANHIITGRKLVGLCGDAVDGFFLIG